MQKMCNAKHQLLHMGEMVCLCSVCCPRSSGGVVKKKKKKQGRSHIWGLGIEYMASFSQFKKNYVEEGRKSCWGFEFLLMCPDGDYEIQ